MSGDFKCPSLMDSHSSSLFLLLAAPWERAPLQPVAPAPRQLLFGCGTLFGIHTRWKWTQQGQFLSTPREPGEAVAEWRCWFWWLGHFWLRHWRHSEGTLGRSEILAERNGSTALLVNVLIVTDSQRASEIFGKGSQRMGGGHIGLLFLFLFLSVFLISFCLFLAERDCSPDPRLRAKERFYLGWWGHFSA